jgi:predicted nucleic acid-binding protein
VILLDTNVISELLKATPDPAVERWFLLHEDDCCIASVAIAELAYGIAKLEDGARKARFQSQLAEWRIRFASRTFAFDVMAALAYGDIQAEARRVGRPMSVPDAQMAAIAKDQGFSLATRNTRDFATSGVPLLNPWMPEAEADPRR